MAAVFDLRTFAMLHSLNTHTTGDDETRKLEVVISMRGNANQELAEYLLPGISAFAWLDNGGAKHAHLRPLRLDRKVINCELEIIDLARNLVGLDLSNMQLLPVDGQCVTFALKARFRPTQEEVALLSGLLDRSTEIHLRQQQQELDLDGQDEAESDGEKASEPAQEQPAEQAPAAPPAEKRLTLVKKRGRPKNPPFDAQLLGDAKEAIRGQATVSISFMQSALGVGYNRAAGVLDALAEEGLLMVGEKGNYQVIEGETA